MGLIINPRQIIKDGITSLRDVWSSSKVSTELSGKQATLVSGVNIKTINNTSLLGSGDITISGGGDIPRIDMTATTATLEPNKFYVWGEVASLDISLAAEIAGIENVYKFQFQSGATATTLTLPSSVKWSSDMTISIGVECTYIVSIESNIAKIERKRKESLLPTAYQQVEFIQATGSQYIDTGIEGNSLLTIEVDMQTPIDGQWAFGCRRAWNADAVVMHNNTSNMCYVDYGSQSYNVSAAISNDGLRHTHTIDKGIFMIDTTVIYSYAQASFSTGYSIILFAFYDVTEAMYRRLSNGKLFKALLRYNGVDVAELYPCYCKSDNVAGMYDIVRDVFLTNAGSGSFIVGPDV